MHYCYLVVTDKLPTEEQLEQILEPYARCNQKPHAKLAWDDWRIGGRFNSLLKLKVDKADEKYKWQYSYKSHRNNELFWSITLNHIKSLAGKENENAYAEEDFYNALGFEDGYLRVDSCLLDEIINLDDIWVYGIISADGKVYTREYYDEKTKHFEDCKEEFEKDFKRVIDESKGHYLTVIDIHE